MKLIFYMIILISVLISISFLTLFEQKSLSYLQLRKGPNKVSMFGMLQPFSDAVKLFTKEFMIPKFSNYYVYLVSPIFALTISLMSWFCFPFIVKMISFNLSILYLLSCLSLGVYSVMLSGWSSNSNYSLLGSLRSIAQTISYEVCLILILLSYLFLLMSLNLLYFNEFQMNLWFVFINLPISFVLIIIFLAETNRSPFDFAEGESELVSGFNVEYSSGGFALIFLAEYSSILFMSTLFSLIFLSGNIFSLFFFFKVVLLSFIYIWVRASFPRYRYDLLMYLTWKKYLPISLNYLFFIIMIKVSFLFLILSL